MVMIAVFLFALFLLAIAVAAYGIALYNALVDVKHQVDQSWSNIDVLLKQRHDELPKLIDVVKSHAGYESGLLEKLTALRARTGAGLPDGERLAAEQALSQGIHTLLATAEAYPQLKASEAYLELQQRIGWLEEQIAHRREYYNAAVNLNNVRMEQFPNMFFTGLAGMARRPLFAAAEQERADVDVGTLLAQ